MDEKEIKLNKEHPDHKNQIPETGKREHSDKLRRIADAGKDEVLDFSGQTLGAGGDGQHGHLGADAEAAHDELSDVAGQEADSENKGQAYLAYFREHSSGPEQEILTAEQRQRIKRAVLGYSADPLSEPADTLTESNILNLQTARGSGTASNAQLASVEMSARKIGAVTDEKPGSAEKLAPEEMPPPGEISLHEGISVGGEKRTIWKRLLQSSVVPLAAVLIVLVGFYFAWQMISNGTLGGRSKQDAAPAEAMEDILTMNESENAAFRPEEETDEFACPAETQIPESVETPEAFPPDNEMNVGTGFEDGEQGGLLNDWRCSWAAEYMALLESDGGAWQKLDIKEPLIDKFAAVEGAENSELILYQRDTNLDGKLNTFGYCIFQAFEAADVPGQAAKLEAFFKEYQYSFVSVDTDLEEALAVLRSTDAQLSHIGEQAAQGIINQEMRDTVQIWLLWK